MRTTLTIDDDVLAALVDPAHVQHDVAHEWFGGARTPLGRPAPFTENGLVRIVGHPRYPNSPGTPAAAAAILAGLRALPGHEFWSDDISLMDRERFDTECLLTHGQVRDSYLLALARNYQGQLATFSRKLIVDAVRNGAAALHLI